MNKKIVRMLAWFLNWAVPGFMTKKNALTIIRVLKELSMEMGIKGYGLSQSPLNHRISVLRYLWDLVHDVNEKMPTEWIFLSRWLYHISRPLKDV